MCPNAWKAARGASHLHILSLRGFSGCTILGYNASHVFFQIICASGAFGCYLVAARSYASHSDQHASK